MSVFSPIYRDSSEPLYLQVARHLRDAIADGTYSPSALLPSELELTTTFDVSRPTVRRALQILSDEGLIERVPGRGTYVKERTPPIRGRREGTLLRQGVHTLALIAPNMRASFEVNLVMGAEKVVSQHEYHLVLCTSGRQVSLEQKYLLDLWRDERAAGFVLLAADAPQPHRVLREFVRAGVPTVLVDRYFANLALPFVVSDNLRAGYIATKHLVDLGHQRIGFVTRPNLYVSSVAHRFQGYKKVLSEAGLEYDPGLVCQGLLPLIGEAQDTEWAEYDRRVIREFLAQPRRPSAVLACNDAIAIQVLAGCRELGLRVPQDLALVSYDDADFAALLDPPLTTVRQQTYEMGARAAALLLDMLGGQPVEQQVFLPVELMVRRSCGAACC